MGPPHGLNARLQQPPVATRAQQLQELPKATARGEVPGFKVKDLPMETIMEIFEGRNSPGGL